MVRFLLTFIALVTVLFAAELTAPVQQYFVLPWTAMLTKSAAYLLQWVDPTVISQGKVLATAKGTFAISVEAGCNGIEALIILIAAMIAFPAPWRHRMWGIFFGAIAVQALNLVRVVSLFYIGQWSMDVFHWMHLYAWQALIMLDVLFVWILWIRALPKNLQPSAVTNSDVDTKENMTAANHVG
jgi:exosortase H (IPTLxxWG-CTERM-specific)